MNACDICGNTECGHDRMAQAFGLDKDKQLFYRNNGFRESPLDFDSLMCIEKMANDLPDVDYILDSIVNYMFTNELTTGKEGGVQKDKEKLDNWLISKNFNGQRNIDVLREVAKGYRKYGYYGLLATQGGIVGVHPLNILAVTIDNPDIPVLKQTLTYVIRRTGLANGYHGDPVYGNGETTSPLSIEDLKRILADPKQFEKDYLVVSDKEFSCVRLDTGKIFGTSPLLKDRKRIRLIYNIIDRMNYDIERNGVGTIVIQTKDSLIDELEEGAGEGVIPAGGELLDVGRTAKKNRDDKIAKELKDIAEQLKETENNDVIALSGRFGELKQLERDTKIVDFTNYLSQYVPAILCQMFGVPARLFDLNKTVSNIGTYSIIDNAMKNVIIPMRTYFVNQCSDVIKHASGISEEVTFASYEFTKDYNYSNDNTILDVYERLLKLKPELAEAYLAKNMII